MHAVSVAQYDVVAAVQGGYALTNTADIALSVDTPATLAAATEVLDASGGLKELMKITAQGAARLMAEPDGPRLAALAFDGWDTHSNEGGAIGQLANMLSGLDEAIAAFETQLGPVWKETVLMIVTEFGRTAAINGTIGTDHGTGTIAFLVGGAISGGRVVTDWPGLKPQQLHDGRDLAPTTDLRAAMKGVLYDHLGLSPEILRNRIFPNSNAVAISLVARMEEGS